MDTSVEVALVLPVVRIIVTKVANMIRSKRFKTSSMVAIGRLFDPLINYYILPLRN